MPTRKQILAAFRNSKAHWLRLATGQYRADESIFNNDCAFCALCPCLNIGKLICPLATDKGCCDGLYAPVLLLFRRAPSRDLPEFKTAAKAVYDFIALAERDFIKKGERQCLQGKKF